MRKDMRKRGFRTTKKCVEIVEVRPLHFVLKSKVPVCFLVAQAHVQDFYTGTAHDKNDAIPASVDFESRRTRKFFNPEHHPAVFVLQALQSRQNLRPVLGRDPTEQLFYVVHVLTTFLALEFAQDAYHLGH